MDTHRGSIIDDNEAFFLQITQENGYFYEGADLGILIMRGRLMTNDFELTPRAKKWIREIRSHYKADLLETYETEEDLLNQTEGFKYI